MSVKKSAPGNHQPARASCRSGPQSACKCFRISSCDTESKDAGIGPVNAPQIMLNATWASKNFFRQFFLEGKQVHVCSRSFVQYPSWPCFRRRPSNTVATKRWPPCPRSELRQSQQGRERFGNGGAVTTGPRLPKVFPGGTGCPIPVLSRGERTDVFPASSSIAN